ncbi:Fatty acid desaturase, type 1 [Kalmanozyma brasiliensis GHG001]|uniref:sphingolipid 4-desaturase n=1 Tax=Kalmanozyma brasiliensis (strain GHG001) TaxID=1365824 RepID=V5EU17_KALBG|nr:Fatty acid desaturase, type 1 [Kalmanozyma brasiliensis GHG001]EST05539.1 Fatty acid desaturase, type 1 [Kalmanozyma brasiliensis GHG001]
MLSSLTSRAGRAMNSTIQVDWSLYGGAETTSPPSSSSNKPDRTRPALRSDLSSASSSSRNSRSSSPNFSHQSDSSTSFTSDDDDGDARQTKKATSSDQDELDDAPLSQVSRSAPLTDAVRSATAVDGKAWLPTIVPVDTQSQDFLWMHTEEPHRSRRMAILKAHPEVKRLMGYEPLTKYVSLAVLVLQLSLAVYLSKYTSLHPFSWQFLLLAYAIGGTANQNTFLAIHEITHNLAFRGLRANRAWAILVNAAIGVPYAMAFKPYHLEHHKYLGEDGTDTDLPTKFESVVLRNVLGKAFFATFQIFFYALRPGFVRAQRPTIWHALNIAFIALSNFLLVKFAGWTALVYLLESSFFAGSLHPCAAHFIAEHYMFAGIQQETWSYYGPLNVLAYNVGYHNEHHDFPSVPWTRLPELRRIAPEFYDVLPRHTSWPMVTVRFVLGGDSGLWARVKRVNRDAKRAEAKGK